MSDVAPATYDQHPEDREYGPTILIVDDEKAAQDRLDLALSELEDKDRIHTFYASSIPGAVEILKRNTVHVVLLDIELGPDRKDPAQNGIEAIPTFLKLMPQLQIVMVTASNNVDDVVQAMSLGAWDYITKDTPVLVQIAKLDRAIQHAILKMDMERRVRSENHVSIELAGSSPAFRDVLDKIQVLAESNRPVLIEGEPGTGKSAIAKRIHECRAHYLKQSNRPYFHINVGALTMDTVESELFGHEKHAFTDAKEMKQGFFELAKNGTVFLDEIGEAPLALQVKLLTFLQEGTFYRVGGKQQLYSRPKLIFATNRDLKDMVKHETFRKDLYDRISMFPILMPNLSERREDVKALIQALLPRACDANSILVPFSEIPEDFIKWAESLPLEKNVRSLEHLLDRLLVYSPKDKNNRPILKQWKKIPGLIAEQNSSQSSNGKSFFRESLTLGELLTLPLDVIGPDFPGLNPLLDSITDRILVDARSKIQTNKEIAKILKLAESSTSSKIKRLENGVALRGLKTVRPESSSRQKGVRS